MTQRNEKIANQIKKMAAQFFGRENNKTALLTVTACTVSQDLKKATIFITVFPVAKEEVVLNFIKRNLGDLREFLKKNIPIKTIPFLDAVIDQGEKNRQKIDELLRNS